MSLQTFEWGQTNNDIKEDPLKKHGIIPSLDKLNRDLNKRFGEFDGQLASTKTAVKELLDDSGKKSKTESDERDEEIGHLANLMSQVLRNIYGEDEALKMINEDKVKKYMRDEANETWNQWFWNKLLR